MRTRPGVAGQRVEATARSRDESTEQESVQLRDLRSPCLNHPRNVHRHH